MELFAKGSFDTPKEVRIHVNTNRGKCTRIDFASSADAIQFLKFIAAVNESSLSVLRLSDVHEVLGLPMPSIFADGDWGWPTPVYYILTRDDQEATPVVYIDPISNMSC